MRHRINQQAGHGYRDSIHHGLLGVFHFTDSVGGSYDGATGDLLTDEMGTGDVGCIGTNPVTNFLPGTPGINYVSFDGLGGGDFRGGSVNRRFYFGRYVPFSLKGVFTFDNGGGAICSATSLSANQGWFFREMTNNKLRFEIRNNGSNYQRITTDTTYSVGGLLSVVCTYDGSGSSSGMRIYVNGAPVPVTEDDTMSGGINGAFQSFFIGRCGTAGSEYFYTSDLYELAFWNRELSMPEAAMVSDLAMPGNLFLYPWDQNYLFGKDVL